MNLLKVIVVLIACFISSVTLISQEESLDKFDRIYRVPADRSMFGQSVQQTEGGEYIVLTTVDTLDPAIPDVTATNLTQFDKKGNVNWSVDYIIEDTLSLMPFGNVIIDSEGGYIFSARSKFETNSNFVVRTSPMGAIIWSYKYASGESIDSIGRIDIVNPNDSLIVMLGTTSLNGNIETKLTGIEEATGDIIWDKIITITDQTDNTIRPDIRNISVTQDSNIVITGSVEGEKYIFVNKHSHFTGNVIWSRKYEVPNVDDARLVPNDIAVDVDSNLLITGLLNSDIIGNATAGRSNVSDAYVLKLDRDGLVDWSSFFDFGEEVISSGLSITSNEGGSPLVMIGGQNNVAGAFFPIQAIIDSVGNVLTARDYSIFLNSTSNNAEIITTADNGSMLVGTGIEHGIGAPDGADLGFFYPRLIKTDLMGTTLCDTSINSSLVPFTLEADTLLWNVVDRPGDGGDTLEIEAFTFNGYTAPILSLRDTMFCPGDPVLFVLDATTPGATQYQWFTADEPDNILSVDSMFLATEIDVQYIARVFVEEDLCYIMCDTTTLTEIMPPMVSLLPNIEQFCEDRSIGVGAQIGGGGQITNVEWSTGEQNVQFIFPNELGSYSVTVTNSCGDEGEASITISEADLPQPQDLVLIADSPNLCTTGAITITAQNQGLTNLLWSTNEQTMSIEVTEPGTYSLMATDFCGFEVDNSIQVTDEDFLTPLAVSLENDKDNCSGGFVPIQADISGNIQLITWFNSAGQLPNSIQVNPLRVDSAGTYTIRVVDICDNVIEESIEVTNADLTDCGRTTDACLEFPNAFIPTSELMNDDGEFLNRTFGPHNSCSDGDIIDYDLKIFNRWGQKVFESSDIDDEWTGRKGVGGTEYPGDVYVFVASYSTGSDEIKLRGDVTLVR